MELKQFLSLLATSPICLLIVPYGIETSIVDKAKELFLSFNRTLWN